MRRSGFRSHTQRTSSWLKNKRYEVTSKQQLLLISQRLIRRNQDSKTWLYGLERFPNLTDFHISLQEARKPNHGLLHSIMSRTFVEPDVYIDDEPQIPVLPILERLKDPSYTTSMPRKSPLAIDTLHLEGINIRSFPFLTVRPGTGLAYLRGIRQLQLDIGPTEGLAATMKFEMSELGTTLIAINGLVKLQVSCLKPAWELSLNDIFQDEHIWPNLTHVELEGIDSKPEDLAGFIERHRRSLQRLIVRDSPVDEAVQGFNAALLKGQQLLECDPSGSLSRAFASAAIRHQDGDGCRSFIASWD